MALANDGPGRAGQAVGADIVEGLTADAVCVASVLDEVTGCDINADPALQAGAELDLAEEAVADTVEGVVIMVDSSEFWMGRRKRRNGSDIQSRLLFVPKLDGSVCWTCEGFCDRRLGCRCRERPLRNFQKPAIRFRLGCW